jgi:leucyl-tRNA synthetase
MLYKAPPSEVLEWDDISIVGMQRWLSKVHKLAGSVGATGANSTALDISKMDREESKIYRFTNATINQVTDALSTSFGFNTAISDLIKLSNFIGSSSLKPERPAYRHAVENLVKMIAPMAPNVAEESWEMLSKDKQTSIFSQQWPSVDQMALIADEIKCVVQVSGILQFECNCRKTIIDIPHIICRLMEKLDILFKFQQIPQVTRLRLRSTLNKHLRVKSGSLERISIEPSWPKVESWSTSL